MPKAKGKKQKPPTLSSPVPWWWHGQQSAEWAVRHAAPPPVIPIPLRALVAAQLTSRKIALKTVADAAGSIQTLMCPPTATPEDLALIPLLHSLDGVDLSSCRSVDSALLSALAPMTSVSTVNVASCRFDRPGLRALCEIKSLTSLDLSRCQGLQGTDLCGLSALVDLETLCLAECSGVTGVALEAIGALPELTALDLTVCDLSGDVHRHLAAPRRLVQLSLACCGITPAVLKSIARVATLTDLNLDSTTVSSAGGMDLGPLAGLPLRALDLSSCGWFGAGLAALHSLHLRTLVLHRCGDISDGGFRFIGSLRHLTSLDLSCCVLGERIKQVAALEHLEDLRLSGCILNQPEFDVLSGMTALTALDVGAIGGTCRDAHMMECLAALFRLRTLSVSYCRAPAESLAQLRRLPRLTSLDLSHCIWADLELLAHLSRSPRLTEIRLHRVNQSDALRVEELAPRLRLRIE